MSAWFEDPAFWDDFKGAVFHARRLAQTPAEVDALVKLLDLEPPARILDLACGIGRHSAELARRGFAVTGVDLHDPHLAEARVKAPEVEWIRADMRAFRRPGAFDAVLNLYTSFGYFDDPADDLRVARNALESLKSPGGAFVIEMKGKEILAKEYQERRWIELEDGSSLLSRLTVENGWRTVRDDWVLLKGGERREGHFKTRLYAATELERLLLDAGFSDVALHGWLDGRPYGPGSPRLVAVARRR
ncbi:MAG TPA: methyltransferase domain-containing protein [Planctomycetota bacterium]|nr:methyltransferase domain-containing protein [Planctomycetota bacterium]